MSEPPWCDCKVAYGIDDFEKFERWMDRTDDGKGLLPEGWSLCETDGSGASGRLPDPLAHRIPAPTLASWTHPPTSAPQPPASPRSYR